MKLKFMPEALLATMKRSISENIRRYGESSTPWIDDYLKEKNLYLLAESNIEIDAWPTLIDGRGEVVTDALAAERVYECFRKLKPVQAADERLWAYLCHIEPFYTYVRAPWGADGTDTKESVVNRRFFFENRGLGGIAKNALSRSWWSGYLTCEEGTVDPYSYTKMLLQYTDTPVGLLERSLGKNPEIVKHVSKFVYENANGWKDRSHTIQKLIRGINSAGGALVLDALSAPHMDDLCRQCVR